MRHVSHLNSTTEAAFAVDEKGLVVGWNAAAERLLGYEVAYVLRRLCHQVVRGRDRYGNLFCCPHCPILRMVAQREAVRPFSLDLCTLAGEVVRARVVVLTLALEPQGTAIVHLLTPKDSDWAGPDVRSQVSDAVPGAAIATRPRFPLSATEQRVLELLAEGKSTRGIALALSISPLTVRNHVQHILHKLGVHSRLEAVVLARRKRLR